MNSSRPSDAYMHKYNILAKFRLLDLRGKMFSEIWTRI